MSDLHSQIMNLPCVPPDTLNGSQAYDYKIGHRDARHAAAELALAQDARIRQMEEALRRLLIGCEHKTLYGVTGWHQKTMPSDMALDMARAALKEPS